MRRRSPPQMINLAPVRGRRPAWPLAPLAARHDATGIDHLFSDEGAIDDTSASRLQYWQYPVRARFGFGLVISHLNYRLAENL